MNEDDTYTFVIITVRWVIAFLCATMLSLHGYKKKSLDWTGSVAAFFVGFLSLGSSYRFGSLLLLFYYSSSKLTKIKEDIKATYEENYVVGGQRNWIQVFANSILAVILSVYYFIVFGEDRNIFFKDALYSSSASYLTSQISCMIVAHYACANGDTWASEVGILSPSKPRLITSFCLREVPPGTNGGISVTGSVASGCGGAFIGLIYFVFSLLTILTYTPISTSFAWTPVLKQQVLVILYGGLCGILGSLIDSLLGATCQASYYSNEKQKIVKYFDLKKDPSIVKISGYDVLSNEAVNFLSIALTMIFSWWLSPLFFTAF